MSIQEKDESEIKQVVILYKNYRGETSFRKIKPLRIYFGHTEHHPKPQWFVEAWDSDRQATRDFALNDVLRWSSESWAMQFYSARSHVAVISAIMEIPPAIRWMLRVPGFLKVLPRALRVLAQQLVFGT